MGTTKNDDDYTDEVLELYHYGMPRRSGRYPWGSGDNPYQHGPGTLTIRDNELKKTGLSEVERAKSMGFNSTTDLRAALRAEKNEEKQYKIDTAETLSKKYGLGPTEIGKRMGGVSESTVRGWLKEAEIRKTTGAVQNTKNRLKAIIKEKKAIDVGPGVELELGVSRSNLDQAIKELEAEGYSKLGRRVQQPTDKTKQTIINVLGRPGLPKNYLYEHLDEVQPAVYHEPSPEESTKRIEKPVLMDRNRILVRYSEEGGSDRDGTIELRPGVKDLSMDDKSYAQVRIGVEGNMYMKGMAFYSNNIPKGFDVIYNTNKKLGAPDSKVFKKMNMIKDDQGLDTKEVDWANPFGATIKDQARYDDPKGKYEDPKTGNKQSLSVVNRVNNEGEWDDWSRSLSSQFLSKQKEDLIRKQLQYTYQDKLAEYQSIMELENPTVKKYFLESYAQDCDSAAWKMKAAALPRQSTKVILPVPGVKDNEIYAPTYKDGEKVALVRYPHGGTFEIPILTVNNRNKEGKAIIQNHEDAVGINKHTADMLSGADFDGDTVIVIPTHNGKVKIENSEIPEGLKGFDTKDQYGGEKVGTKVKMTENSKWTITNNDNDIRKAYKIGNDVYKDNITGEEYTPISERYKNIQMGVVSNLITDMTLHGASADEIARATKHSMVIIDSYKHKLNYKRSEHDNDIKSLQDRYQSHIDAEGNERHGASTLLSRRKSDVNVPKRQGQGIIDPKTGKVTYKESGEMYYDKDGNLVKRTEKVKAITEADKVVSLSSGTAKEALYADYAENMKALANQCRKSYLEVAKEERPQSPSAKQVYAKEVESLTNKLNTALLNAPRERQAQMIASVNAKAYYDSVNGEISEKDYGKIKQRELTKARLQTGSSRKNRQIPITDREWEAIQNNAIPKTTLKRILDNTDADELRERAMPKQTRNLTQSQVTRMKAMAASGGYTIAQIAEQMGISPSTVSKYLKE